MPDQPDPLLTTSAAELRDRLAAGTLTALDLVEACLARIAEREDTVRAWAWIDPDHARGQARALDAHRAAGRPLGRLHGLPVGLKDVIDTQGIPTENGCPVDAGRVPEHDAHVVARLKSEGAIILGKTVTTELAFLHPNKTRNPRNPGHTPGGSSSGSAAAVADGMVPLAIGTQTGGSVIRPASFCGITGFKPSFGAIPRDGVLMQSHTLDTLGVFAADLSGAALLAEALFVEDGSAHAAAPDLLRHARDGLSRPPSLAILRPPAWNVRATPDLKSAFADLVARLGDHATEVALPASFDETAEIRQRINFAEMAHYYRRYAETPEILGIETRDALASGAAIPAADYLDALDWTRKHRPALEAIFAKADAILCPAATGPAPEGLGSTGDAIFNGLWTLFGTPAVTLPLMTAGNGLPIGAQLVAPRGEDARLLGVARWLRQTAT